MIRAALIGYGYSSRTFHAPLLDAVEGLQLVAVVSRNQQLVHREHPSLPVLTLDDLLADPSIDLAIVATPNATHADIATRLLRAGKHVVVDKPFTISVEEAELVSATARGAGRIATIFHNRRWDADFLTLRALIAEGVFGPVTLFESRFDRYRPVVKDRWRERPGPGSGIWWDLGSHLVDQALQLFGEPDAVSGDLEVQRGSGATDFFHVVLRYGPMRAVLASSSLAVESGPRFAVLGTHATYVKFGLDSQESALAAGTRPGACESWGADSLEGVLTQSADDGPRRSAVRNRQGDYRAFYTSLVESIGRHMAPPVTTAEATSVVRILECAARSSDLRRELPPPRGND
jgi:predicted dehydrogenase